MKLGKPLLFSILVLLVMLLLPFSLSFNARAETSLPILNINTGLGYATIQEAIDADATLNGHVIVVGAGTYYENVVVNKSVSLIGEDKLSVIVDGRALGSVINITANNVRLTGFTVRDSMYGYGGVHVYRSSGDNISGNVVRDNYNGVYMYGSSDDIVGGNDVLGNEYGIHLYGSSNVSVSGNAVSSNTNGIDVDVSSNNTLVDNDISSSGGNGIYFYGSSNNTLLGNNVFSNPTRGIGFQYSFDNTLLGNTVSANGDGLYFYDSGRNALTGNTVSFNNESGVFLFDSDENAITGNDILNNTFGIWLINSNASGVSGNNVSSNAEYGVRLWNSSGNTFFHNNFIDNSVKNVEQPSVDSFLNLWDDGAEGNFWGGYDGVGSNVDGIGDKPYVVDQRVWLGVYSQDSYPLMGEYSQFTAAFENQSYTVMVVSNSTVSGFLYHKGQDNVTNALSFQVSGSNASGFFRICIPQVLIAPPYVVTADNVSLSYNVVRTNGTYTWIYFTYPLSAGDLTIKPVAPSSVPVWSQWWFWGISGLVLVEAVLAAFTVSYRRKVAEQMKVLQGYSPFVIAEALFKADIERRGIKIKEFEKKYGVRIQPRTTLEDVIRSLEAKEEEEKKR
jgi:parallel beta-helix repeat protein